MKLLKLEDLTVEQKIGQLLIARSIAKEDDRNFAMELIKNHALGGVQAFVGPGIKEKVIDPVLAAAEYPIFIAADMERGFQLGEQKIPGNLAIGAMDDPELAYIFAKVTAIQAKKIGYNMIWSPVVDLAPMDAICRIPRCLGSDKRRVTELACAYIKAFADCGIIGSAKHYPSTFDRIEDTHMCEAVSYHTKEELLDICLYPYFEMMDRLGEDMMGIMTGHTRCMNIDPDYPASLSKKCIDIIKERGFKGVTITDSFSMMGVIQKFGNENVLGLAVAAGNDIILPNGRIPLRQTYEYLLKCYRDGMFSEERLNDAVSKVLWAQERTLRKPANTELTQADIDAIERMNRDCICAVTDEGLTPAIDTGKRHLFVILMENNYSGGNPQNGYEIAFTKWWDPGKMAALLKEKFPHSDAIFICEFPSRTQNEKVCYEATKYDDVVYVTFSDSECYLGTDGLTERVCMLMHTMAYHIAAVVHVGNPYAMEKIPHVPRILFGFPSEKCMEYLPRVLAGEMEAKGHMPLSLKLK
ncbi:MAG TPA: hypothetical protein DCY74_02015 [Clostridiales bacterium]|jgi:beta-N-acetylhexosaminidase|nr:hypothetical protein [Clostridiales bacterium]